MEANFIAAKNGSDPLRGARFHYALRRMCSDPLRRDILPRRRCPAKRPFGQISVRPPRAAVVFLFFLARANSQMNARGCGGVKIFARTFLSRSASDRQNLVRRASVCCFFCCARCARKLANECARLRRCESVFFKECNCRKCELPPGLRPAAAKMIKILFSRDTFREGLGHEPRRRPRPGWDWLCYYGAY